MLRSGVFTRQNAMKLKVKQRVKILTCVAGVTLTCLGAAPDSRWDHDPAYLFTRPDLTWGRDPFGKKPGYGTETEAEPSYTLTAIFADGNQSEAIINDQRVRVGDEIGWRFVEKIGTNYVLLSDGESTVEATLPISRSPAGRIQLEEVKFKP